MTGSYKSLMIERDFSEEIIMNRTELYNKYCINCVKNNVCKFNALELPSFIFIDYCSEFIDEVEHV